MSMNLPKPEFRILLPEEEDLPLEEHPQEALEQVAHVEELFALQTADLIKKMVVEVAGLKLLHKATPERLQEVRTRYEGEKKRLQIASQAKIFELLSLGNSPADIIDDLEAYESDAEEALEYRVQTDNHLFARAMARARQDTKKLIEKLETFHPLSDAQKSILYRRRDAKVEALETWASVNQLAIWGPKDNDDPFFEPPEPVIN